MVSSKTPSQLPKSKVLSLGSRFSGTWEAGCTESGGESWKLCCIDRFRLGFLWLWRRCALRGSKNISLRIIKSEGEEGAGHAAATRPKMSYFRAGIHDFLCRGKRVNAYLRDLNSDLPVCISSERLKDHVFIYGPVTGLANRFFFQGKHEHSSWFNSSFKKEVWDLITFKKVRTMYVTT